MTALNTKQTLPLGWIKKKDNYWGIHYINPLLGIGGKTTPPITEKVFRKYYKDQKINLEWIKITIYGPNRSHNSNDNVSDFDYDFDDDYDDLDADYNELVSCYKKIVKNSDSSHKNN